MEVPASGCVGGAGPIGDAWISGGAGAGREAEHDATREEQMAAAQGQSGVRSFRLLLRHPLRCLRRALGLFYMAATAAICGFQHH